MEGKIGPGQLSPAQTPRPAQKKRQFPGGLLNVLLSQAQLL